MHYIIFGKFHPQNRPLIANIKVFLLNKDALIRMYAQKYLHHKSKSNLYNQDVFFLEKTKVYRLDSNQYEENGDVIMFDPDVIQNYRYPEMEISNTSLNQYCDKLKTELKDNNIVIHLINM